MPEDRRTASPIATRSRVPWWLLTVLLLVLTGYVYFRASEAIRADVANQIVFLATMAISWWFGSRGQSAKR